MAPGTGIVSLVGPGSLFYNTKAALPAERLGQDRSYKPYLSLTGTSMAAPIVAGTVALMLQANPKLTPNLVKAIIEYTAQDYDYDALTQGAGFLNTKGAVDLARFLTAPRGRPDVSAPTAAGASTILWGNHKLKHGVIKPRGQRLGAEHRLGRGDDRRRRQHRVGHAAATTAECDNIVWGTAAMDADNIVWGTVAERRRQHRLGHAATAKATTSSGARPARRRCDNIVWGTECGGADCDNIVWGTACGDGELDNIVWGTAAIEADNIVWGTSGVSRQHRLGHRERRGQRHAGADAGDDPSRVRRPDFDALFDELDGTLLRVAPVTGRAVRRPLPATSTPTPLDRRRCSEGGF